MSVENNTSSGQSERHEHQPRVKYLLELNDKEKGEFAQRVKKWNGLVRIFVHPYFKSADYHQKAARIQKALRKIIDFNEEKTPPIIVFEAYIYQDAIESWYSGNQDIYVVKTHERRGHPYEDQDKMQARIPDAADIIGREPEHIMKYASIDGLWHQFNSILKEARVHKVLLAGMFLELDLNDNVTELTSKQCVGDVMNGLSQDIEVEVSNLVLPWTSLPGQTTSLFDIRTVRQSLRNTTGGGNPNPDAKHKINLLKKDKI